MLGVLGVLLVLMFVMSIVPQRKRQKKAQEMMNSIRVGTKVKTIGGFIGEVKAIDSDKNEFVLDLSASGDGSTLVTIDKSAIYVVLNPVVAPAETVNAADDVAADSKPKKKWGKKDKQEEEMISFDEPEDDNNKQDDNPEM
ncbi:MAG: preprotein translocase subunit YajC [Clostridia bacterium]|nr:preprotein translocase subunit YajC [Clostridia bacterium]